MKQMHWMEAVILAGAVAVGFWVLATDTAEAQYNPQTNGVNYNVRANRTPVKVNAYGKDCSVTMMVNFTDGGLPASPVCSGYRNQLGDGGIVLTKNNCGWCLCTDTARCHATWVVRDTVPDAIYYLAPFAPDAGVPLLIELGAGCRAPD
jgi:hypothetical protein